MIERYASPQFISLWSDKKKFETWLQIELLALDGLFRAGLIPIGALQCQNVTIDFNAKDMLRIKELESNTKHDFIAFLSFLEEQIGTNARWLHFGLTSSDVIDTALSLTLREAIDIILEDIQKAMEAVKLQAFKHQYTPIIGRSHGMHAEPTTFGLKMALWYDELNRNKTRLTRARDIISVGKLSGAVGTYAHVPPEVEEYVCNKLNLTPANISTQILQRDRHAEVFTTLAIVGSSIEKFATEIRHLQRTEVQEVSEPFSSTQKGSSAMPHKQNPILSENLTGLSRLLRGYALSSLEDIALWHERDISHSSVERVIAPDATSILDFMLQRLTFIIENLNVYPSKMKQNLESSKVSLSQTVLLHLIQKGMERQAAYTIIQRNALKSINEGLDFITLLKEAPGIALTQDDLTVLESSYKIHIQSTFDKVFER